MLRKLLILLAFLTGPAVAQQVDSAAGGQLRVLDKQNGTITDITLRRGQAEEVGLLTLTLQDCRFPISNPSGNAFALLSVTYLDDQEPVFDGWMIASSPALNAMDHPRYDVWVLRCEV